MGQILVAEFILIGKIMQHLYCHIKLHCCSVGLSKGFILYSIYYGKWKGFKQKNDLIYNLEKGMWLCFMWKINYSEKNKES